MEKEIKKTLREWGCSDIEILHESVWFVRDGYECEIDILELDLEDKETLNEAVMYSCCGQPLDPDYMICPVCLEHC